MLQDRYGFALSTASAEARDAYVAGVDLSLSANHGAEAAFRRAIALDEGLAVAHAALARTLQVQHKPAEAKAAAARARELAAGLPHRERSHAIALATTVDGGSVAGLAAVKEHLAHYPRDAMVLAPCTGVFGLIGFSGRPGREAELLALLEPLAGAYGDDWWFTSALAFAQVEAGDIDRALPTIERSLACNPRNANGSHIRAHVYYESGERAAGLAYLEEWWRTTPSPSLLHCHLSWHIALWRMELGRAHDAWDVLPRAPAPRRLHRAAAQHAHRFRLVPVPRGDGRRAARPRAVARAQRLRHAVVPRARHRLCRRARRAGPCACRQRRRAGQDRRRRQGTGEGHRGADLARLPCLRPLRIGPPPSPTWRP